MFFFLKMLLSRNFSLKTDQFLISIPGRVIPKTQKIVLDASLLNTQHYKVGIKGKGEFLENTEPQTLQEYGFSPVWVCMWYFKYDPSENLDPQTSQENGFSPVCVRMCRFKWEFPEIQGKE